METIKIIKRLRIPFGVFMMVIISTLFFLGLVYFPPEKLVDKSPTLTCFYGIAILTLLVGILLLAGIIIWQWFVLIRNAQKQEEKDVEDQNKLKQQELLNDDSKERRVYERERDPVNDLFRLAELSKIKTEKTIVRKEAEKSKVPNTISETNKKEENNIQELNRLLEHYQSLFSKQQTT